MNDTIAYTADEVPWSSQPVVRPSLPDGHEQSPLDAILLHETP